MRKPKHFPYDEIRLFFPVLGFKDGEDKAYFWILVNFFITFLWRFSSLSKCNVMFL